MKKQTAFISILLVTLLVGAGTVFAQTSAEESAEVSAASGGGLGKGINSMVRGILGESENDAARKSAQPSEPSAMMQMNAVSDQGTNLRIASPQSQTMSMKAAFVADTVIPMSDEELRAYIHDQMTQDSNIQSIDSSDTHVRITYTIPSKVFRVVKFTLRVTASATVSGETEVTYPWYAFAASSAVQELRVHLRENVEPLIPRANFTPDEQRMLIDELHVSLAAQFGAPLGGDR